MFCRAVGFFDQRDARMMAKYAFFIAKPTMVFVKIGASSALGELATISVARLIIHPVLVAALFLLIPGGRSTLDQGGAAVGLPAGGGECVRAVGPLWWL